MYYSPPIGYETDLAARKGTEGAEMCVVKTITKIDQPAPRLVIPPFKRKVHTI